MSQNATSSSGGRRKLPFAFTEHGVLMLSSILNSTTAIQVNIKIMRIYIKLREILFNHKEILLKLEQLEKQMFKQDALLNKHENEIQHVFSTLKQLLSPQPIQRKKDRF
jgi:hypothetical protein